MTKSADPDQLASSSRSRSAGSLRSQLIWIYTVCKSRAHQVLARTGLIDKWILRDQNYNIVKKSLLVKKKDSSPKTWFYGEIRKIRKLFT